MAQMVDGKQGEIRVISEKENKGSFKNPLEIIIEEIQVITQ